MLAILHCTDALRPSITDVITATMLPTQQLHSL